MSSELNVVIYSQLEMFVLEKALLLTSCIRRIMKVNLTFESVTKAAIFMLILVGKAQCMSVLKKSIRSYLKTAYLSNLVQNDAI